MLLLLLAAAAGYVVLKGSGGLPSTAPIPPGQTAGSTAASPIAGHVMPAPSGPPSAALMALPDAVRAQLPWPDVNGIWRDNLGQGAPHQFTDCNNHPIGQPGYMPLEYKAYLDGNRNCDGGPIAGTSSGGGGGGGPDGAQVAQTAAQLASTAAGVAAAAGGAGDTAAAVGAAASAALALL